MAPMNLDTLLDEAVFGTATQGTDIAIQCTITNTNAEVFVLANVHLHVLGDMDDVGDLVQYPRSDAYADIVRTSLDIDELPKSGHTHGNLTSDQNRAYTILSVDTRGSRLRLWLSSELV